METGSSWLSVMDAYFADCTFVPLTGRLGLVLHRGSGHHTLSTLGGEPLRELRKRFGSLARVRLRAPSEAFVATEDATSLECARHAFSTEPLATWSGRPLKHLNRSS